MANETAKIHKFKNGMTLVCESMAEVSSAAFYFMVSGGSGRDPEGRTGTATVLAEMLFRGAGDRDNRALNDALDALGLHRSSGVGDEHCSLSGALVAEQLPEALEIYGDILQRATLADDGFEPSQALALQGIDSLEDDPRQRISILAHEKYLPYPYGRPTCGKRDELAVLTADEVRGCYGEQFSPEGMILAVAGMVDFDEMKDVCERLFGAWEGSTVKPLAQGEVALEQHHESNDGAQVHIAVLYPSVIYGHEQYYAAMAATGVLSGGMGSRLFTEVREKRGLCYAVGASHRIFGPYGAVQAYVGSTPDNAQEALDVTLAELRKLADGVSREELDRAKVGLRASLIMAGESSGARAAAAARDMRYLGRVRSLEEIEQAVNALSVDDVVGYAQAFRPEAFSVTTIGPTALNVR